MISAGEGQLHAALIYGSVEELAAAAVPFLADGLAAGECVALACREDHNAVLAELLGHDDRIVLLPRERVYTRSAPALARYRHLVHRQVTVGVPRVRLVSEVPVDHRAREWPEWHRYEAIFNIALDPLPLSSVCAYDEREMPDSIREGVEETHPALLRPGGFVPNDRYLDPATVLRRTSTNQVERDEDAPPVLLLTDLADVSRLPECRARVRAALDGPGEQEQLRGHFAAAVAEVLANAFRHGRPPVALRLWVTPTRLECLVTDGGDGFDDPLAGYALPGNGSPPVRAGLWLVRQACDTLEASRTPTGFAIRLTARLPGASTSAASASGAAHAEAAAARVDRARADARVLARRLHGQF